MIEVNRAEDCCGCAACADACPVNCIRMAENAEGFTYPRVDATVCIECGRCERICPSLAEESGAPALSAYAARTTDPDVLLNSSSGGVFTELCRQVLDDGGVVYGVAMDADCRGCSFARADTLGGIAPMRGSKYMQADGRGVYGKVLDDLRAGRMVLFSGVPCQVNALVRLVGARRDNLVAVDCICHGVPSPKLWSEHVNHLETTRCAKVTSVGFRCKEISWRRFGLKASVGNEAVFQPLERSSYLRMFLRDYCLRPSCYACKAKMLRLADMTIADFWGIENVVPEMSDELGCSLAIARTDAGAAVLEAASSGLEMREVHYEDAVRSNRAEHSSAIRPPERDRFFEDLDQLGYAAVERKYGSPDLKERSKWAVKDALAAIGLLDVVRKLRGRVSVNEFRYGMLIKYGKDD